MRLAVTSDTHGRKFVVPNCDVFIHCGDFTALGNLPGTAVFADYLKDSVSAKHIILVPGNHDIIFQNEPNLVKGLFDERVKILIDEGIEIEGKTFYGSPWTPPFFNWSYMKTEPELARVYEQMPGNLDVLITHGPPRGILDPGHQDPHVGSTSLLDAVASRTGHIKHHVFGHLHGAGGKSFFNAPYGPYFHNVAACDEAYRLVNHPTVFEI